MSGLNYCNVKDVCTLRVHLKCTPSIFFLIYVVNVKNLNTCNKNKAVWRHALQSGASGPVFPLSTDTVRSREVHALEYIVVVFVVATQSDLRSQNQTVGEEDLRCRVNPHLETVLS